MHDINMFDRVGPLDLDGFSGLVRIGSSATNRTSMTV